MNIKTFRARSLQAALAVVRRELGPEAAVLHTREVRAGLWGLISGRREFEITASTEVNVPSRLPAQEPAAAAAGQLLSTHTHQSPASNRPRTTPAAGTSHTANTAWRPARDLKAAYRDELQHQLSDLQSMVEDLCRRSRISSGRQLPPVLFELFTSLIEAEMSEELARELVERAHLEFAGNQIDDALLLRARIASYLDEAIDVGGPITLRSGQAHVVALVGPTGVGKTTTIAKLAANFRLREKRRVGLITVDTYRIAAVEQLRTYADIIDLPMKVVATPREMREAVRSMSELDLVLIDTAGRSPKDEVKLQELRAFLSEAEADEVHLVLSAVASAGVLQHTANQFSAIGTTRLILTKLDEATGLGNLLPLLRESKLPLSYLTDGQNVPDDIAPAQRNRLTSMMLGA